jgi:hypothetical protein
MSTPFDGQWVDGGESIISVSSTGDILTVSYSNGRGPFSGMSVTVGAPVLYVDFVDDAPGTGVLLKQGNQICWNNETVWMRLPNGQSGSLGAHGSSSSRASAAPQAQSRE